MVLVVPRIESDAVVKGLTAHGTPAHVIGSIVARESGGPKTVVV
jgi:phosphoribosylaminoimidazole (AIR) synthetase